MADKNVRFSPDALENGIVWMTPAQYLDLSPSLKDPHAGEQAEELKASLERGEHIDKVPSLTINDAKVIDQDGRHRALAAQAAGIRMIPVKVEGEMPEDGKLVSMMGKMVRLDASALSPKPWQKIVASSEYKALPPEKKERLQRQYLNDVVLPRFSKDDQAVARDSFMRQAEMRTPPTMKVDPAEGMGVIEGTRANIGRVGTDLWLGAKQLVGAAGYDEAQQKRQLDAPLNNAPGATAGKIIGNVGFAAPAMLIPGANTVVGGTLVGGAMGALEPTQSPGERLSNVGWGGATGGTLTAAARALPTAYRALIDPFTATGRDRIALDTIGRFAKDPAAIANVGQVPTELVPGSRMPLSEVTRDPGIAQLERVAQAGHPEVANAFSELKEARMGARRNALRDMSGPEGEREFYEAARSATARRLYGQAFSAPIDQKAAAKLAPQIQELLARPSVQTARAEALKLAQEEGQVLKNADLDGGSMKGLHYTKVALDDQINAAKRDGNDNLARLLTGTRDKLLDVMDRVSPDYKAARAVYAADSKPINRMEVARFMYDKLVPALTDEGGLRASPSRYAEALRQGDDVARRVTGMQGAKLADILEPSELQMLRNIGKDVGSEAWAMDAAKVPGSPTAQYLAGRNAMRQVTGAAGLPNWLESWTFDMLSKRASQIVEGSKTEKLIGARLGQFLAEPKTAAEAAARRAAAAQTIPMSVLNFANERLLPPAAVGAGNAAVNQQ
jgi:hypothetical protein